MSDNLRIWSAVEKTDPKQTTHVNQRGGFTAINANYQIMNATKQFGPIGIGWGYTTDTPIFHDTLIFVPVTLWHGDRANTFGPMLGCEEWKSAKGHIDSDASKKATTDGLTKLLSQLGFNADVFLGKFDDQKYVSEVAKEFEPKPAVISAAQFATLTTLIEQSGADTKAVCTFYKVPSIKEMTADSYEHCVAQLNNKLRKKEAA